MTETRDVRPVVTAAQTVDSIVNSAKRKNSVFRLRRAFLQHTTEGKPNAGPLAGLVTAQDRTALVLYLLLMSKASGPPWDAALPATVWARALGMDLPESKTARSTISKAWLRLERHKLVERGERRKRQADVFLLCEDGSGERYTSPGENGEPYLQVPLALWRVGPEGEARRWYEVLTLAELAVLLIARSLGDGFRLPAEEGPNWYGVSGDTIGRGLSGLQRHGLLVASRRYRVEPLTPTGYTADFHYTLQPPFGPVGRASRARMTALFERVEAALEDPLGLTKNAASSKKAARRPKQPAKAPRPSRKRPAARSGS